MTNTFTAEHAEIAEEGIMRGVVRERFTISASVISAPPPLPGGPRVDERQPRADRFVDRAPPSQAVATRPRPSGAKRSGASNPSTSSRPSRSSSASRLSLCALWVLCGFIAFTAMPASAQDLTVTAPPQSQPIALINATIHPISAEPIEQGYLVFEKGRITQVAAGAPAEGALPTDTLLIECAGKHVYPGMIAINSQLGLTEIGAVRSTHDYDELGDITPEVRAAIAVNPDSTLLPVTRSNGVLLAGIFPSGGVIRGRVSVIQLEGWTWEDMTIEDSAGLVVGWPYSRIVHAWWMDKSEEEQRKDIREHTALIRDTFAAADAYFRARAADPAIPIDLRYEAMREFLPSGAAGEGAPGEAVVSGGAADHGSGAHASAADSPLKPVFILANDYEQITAAAAFIAEEGLRGVIVGGRDARLCTDLLKQWDIPVVVDNVYNFPKRDDQPYNEMYALPAALEEAGVRWCMTSGDPDANERNLPYAAAMAVAHGLDKDAALRGITLSTAEILGVETRVGSLDVGKDATLIVTTGSPMEYTTQISHAFIQGRRIDLSNKQTKLNSKYREKYRQLEGAK